MTGDRVRSFHVEDVEALTRAHGEPAPTDLPAPEQAWTREDYYRETAKDERDE